MAEALTRAEERLFIALQQREQREQRRLFLAEGVRLVEELLASDLAVELAAVSTTLEDTPRGQALTAALSNATQIRRIAENTLRRIAATDSPQGVVAVGRMPSWSFDSLTIDANAIALVLDAIQDPGNFGTLVRSAEAFGAAPVLALDGTVDPWNPKVVRATAGSLFRVPVLQSAANDALTFLRSRRFRILVADSTGDSPGNQAGDGPVALFIGNEGAGVRESVRTAADAIVAIPVRGRVESLNAAVAGSILLYLLRA
ncbi:MAG: TrmH family RNA methyltransferase [Longimicrobiales bacterium]